MIRPAKYTDFKAIKQLFSIAFDEEYKQLGLDMMDEVDKWQKLFPVAKLLTTFHNPYQNLVNIHVYEGDDKKIEGLIQISNRSKDQTRWHVENIAVIPDKKAKGIAKDLLEYMFENYMNKGVNRFTIEVGVNNVTALKLYESLGFRKYTTIHYFKVSNKKLQSFKKDDVVSVPEGFRKYKPADSKGIYELYTSCTPSSIRIVDQKELADFQESAIEQVSNYIKDYTKKSTQFHFVVEKDNQIIASLEIIAQYKKLPHVIRLLVHSGFPDLNEQLLIYAFNKLLEFPARNTLLAASEHQKAKVTTIKELKIPLISSDFLMVKDNFQIVNLPETASDMKKFELSGLKPIFTNKDHALR